MGRADDYERRAAEAQAAADEAKDPEVKRDWTNLAEQWRQMARYARREADFKEPDEDGT